MSPEKEPGRKLDGDEYTLHALSYHWEGFEPHLECFDTSEGGECELDLKMVSFAVSEHKTCVGLWDEDGKYVPCPKGTPVTKFSQCPDCSREVFLPDQDCVFEPKCDGEDPVMCGGGERVRRFCSREHVVYVAFYDTRMKIGMSSRRRVEERLIEQGADAYSVLGEYRGRKRAREEEKKMSRRLGIPEWYQQQQILNRYSRPLDIQGMEGRLKGIRATLGRSQGIEPGPLTPLSGYPIDLPLAGVPKLQKTSGEHSGEYVGIKGKWLIYGGSDPKALNLSDLPGRFIARRVA